MKVSYVIWLYASESISAKESKGSKKSLEYEGSEESKDCSEKDVCMVMMEVILALV